MAVYRLMRELNIFPRPELAEDNGLLAVGGDLNIERLFNAYTNGIFPWYNPGEEILWWCPKERFVIFPADIHISKSLRKILRKTAFEVRIDEDFSEIMHNCRMLRENATWITDEMEIAYHELFSRGFAKCVGVYEGDELIGGLYGVAIGKCFFGESMFSKRENASKIALVKLCEELTQQGFVFIDCQFHTDHLQTMGGRVISWKEYKFLLNKGVV